MGTTAARSMWPRVLIASTVGTTLEWYDYNLYTFAAALAFAPLFFPKFDPLTGTLASFATLTAGFVARPLGGVVLGHFGDRIGRKSMLVFSIMLAGVPTVLIGCLPTYGAIGIWAPILLVTLRFIQGFGLGGEWGGAVLMSVEYSPAHRRGLAGSWPQLGSPVGSVLATGVVALSAATTGHSFLVWGWRIPFLLSVILLAVGLYVRLRVAETPMFVQLRETASQVRIPFRELLQGYPRQVLLGIGSRAGIDVGWYVIAVFALSYISTRLGMPAALGPLAVAIGSFLEAVTMPIFGSLSDRVGRRPVFLYGAAFLGAWSVPFFLLIATRNPVLVVVAVAVGLALAHSAAWSVMGSFYPELFDTRVRYSGASTAFQVAGIIGGGPAPLVATALLVASHSTTAVMGYALLACAVSFICCLLLPETVGRALGAADVPAAASLSSTT